MRILRVDPGKKPVIMDIDGSLESMQTLVGGMIQAVFPFADAVAVVCNDEAKLMGMAFNRALRDPDTEQIYDVICGTMFLCGAPADCDHFTNLTPEQLERYAKYYERPEVLLNINGSIVVLNM